jgi:HAD superfamily hydrolase (TIGR01549 family)
MTINAVVFDVGETLVDESREYGTWADWLGVPRHTFSAVFGMVLAQGLDYRETFQRFRPGFDLDVERAARSDAGHPEWFGEDDLYADARPCIKALQGLGLWLGVAGNQTLNAGAILRGLDLGVDMVATSDDWGANKPDREFFDRLVAECPCPAEEILYVGDRLDNDVRPAHMAGLRTAHIKRGPWGLLVAADPELREVADVLLDSLNELPAAVKRLNAARGTAGAAGSAAKAKRGPAGRHGLREVGDRSADAAGSGLGSGYDRDKRPEGALDESFDDTDLSA